MPKKRVSLRKEFFPIHVEPFLNKTNLKLLYGTTVVPRGTISSKINAVICIQVNNSLRRKCTLLARNDCTLQLNGSTIKLIVKLTFFSSASSADEYSGVQKEMRYLLRSFSYIIN